MEFKKYKELGPYHWIQTETKFSNSQLNPLSLARYQKVAKLIPANVKSILDAGCGDGYLLYLSHKRAPDAKLFGFDTEDAGLFFASQKLSEHNVSATLDKGSIYDISYSENSFDLVLCADVIEHLENYNLALKNLMHVLKPGGLLIMSTPLKKPGGKWDSYHVKEFTGKELLEICNKHFSKCEIFAIQSERSLNYMYKRGRIFKRLLQILTCLGLNLALKEGDPESGKYQQLIIKCEK